MVKPTFTTLTPTARCARTVPGSVPVALPSSTIVALVLLGSAVCRPAVSSTVTTCAALALVLAPLSRVPPAAAALRAVKVRQRSAVRQAIAAGPCSDASPIGLAEEGGCFRKLIQSASSQRGYLSATDVSVF